MTTMELEVGKLELIKEIININNTLTLQSIKNYISELVQHDDTSMSKKDFFAKIDRAKESIERGEGTLVRNTDELHSFLNSL